MDHQDHYANAIRAEPGVWWRMVSWPGFGYSDGTGGCPKRLQWAISEESGGHYAHLIGACHWVR